MQARTGRRYSTGIMGSIFGMWKSVRFQHSKIFNEMFNWNSLEFADSTIRYILESLTS